MAKDGRKGLYCIDDARIRTGWAAAQAMWVATHMKGRPDWDMFFALQVCAYRYNLTSDELWIHHYHGLSNTLAQKNKGLTLWAVKWKINSGVHFDDMASAANEGLCNSVQQFNVFRGYQFSTFATLNIIRFITRAIKEQKDYWARNPVSHEDCKYKPALAPAIDEDTSYLIDRLQVVLAGNLAGLSPREIDILHSRFLADKPATLRAIGDRIGLTKERVRQIQQEALAKLRAAMERETNDEHQIH